MCQLRAITQPQVERMPILRQVTDTETRRHGDTGMRGQGDSPRLPVTASPRHTLPRRPISPFPWLRSGLLILVLVGLGLGLFSSPNMNAVMSSVERKFYGVASATVPTMRYMGATLSMGIVMILFTINMGSAQVTPEYYGAFLQSARMTFLRMNKIRKF